MEKQTKKTVKNHYKKLKNNRVFSIEISVIK